MIVVQNRILGILKAAYATTRKHSTSVLRPAEVRTNLSDFEPTSSTPPGQLSNYPGPNSSDSCN